MSDIEDTWRDKWGFRLFAAGCLATPGGLLLALAGRWGVLAFVGVCFAGAVWLAGAESVVQRQRFDAEWARLHGPAP